MQGRGRRGLRKRAWSRLRPRSDNGLDDLGKFERGAAEEGARRASRREPGLARGLHADGNVVVSRKSV